MIKTYESGSEFKKYAGPLLKAKLGDGAEGTAYLTKDGNVLKIIYNNMIRPDYDSTMLTTDIIDLESFLFPTEIYTYKGKIIGYKTRYFAGDIFYNNRMIDSTWMDLNQLLKAREKMLKDIEKLSELNYVIVDLPYNILYNGKSLAGCDTLAYTRVDDNIDVLSSNIEALDAAINTKLAEISPEAGYIAKETNDSEETINKLIKANGNAKILVMPFEY